MIDIYNFLWIQFQNMKTAILSVDPVPYTKPKSLWITLVSLIITNIY